MATERALKPNANDFKSGCVLNDNGMIYRPFSKNTFVHHLSSGNKTLFVVPYYWPVRIEFPSSWILIINQPSFMNHMSRSVDSV